VGGEPIDTDPDPDTETEPAPAAEGADDPAAIRSVFVRPMQHLVSETLDRCWRRLVTLLDPSLSNVLMNNQPYMPS
jgi:hypothetical protein